MGAASAGHQGFSSIKENHVNDMRRRKPTTGSGSGKQGVRQQQDDVVVGSSGRLTARQGILRDEDGRREELLTRDSQTSLHLRNNSSPQKLTRDRKTTTSGAMLARSNFPFQQPRKVIKTTYKQQSSSSSSHQKKTIAGGGVVGTGLKSD